ncbi:hypothetical protein EMPS_08531 [Entomortierella parvispora]|uniref:NAD(P)-binding protein n=1 Tax=Entomortierella parvispora TaxID=205924 RepID=A0A9P3HH25_9FUNG|nr:hypothetical protein EMPS_08531 [Entomortierella parvispora]
MMNVFTQPQFWKTFFTPDRYSHDQIPSLEGKVAIVTGANTGLGYATVVALAGHGAHVFLACRSQEKALAAIDRIQEEIQEKFPRSNPPQLDFLELDLNDMRKSNQAAEEFLKKGLPLHILVNNAGTAGKWALSADGIEKVFAVNYLGHYVFTMALLDRMKESQPARIVNVSSLGHEQSVPEGIDFSTLNDPSKSDNITRYGRAKLAVVLFTKSLARHLADSRVYVNVAYPGFVLTDTDRDANEFGVLAKFALTVTLKLLGMTPDEGALTQLYLATSPEVENEDIRGRHAHVLQPRMSTRVEDSHQLSHQHRTTGITGSRVPFQSNQIRTILHHPGLQSLKALEIAIDGTRKGEILDPIRSWESPTPLLSQCRSHDCRPLIRKVRPKQVEGVELRTQFLIGLHPLRYSIELQVPGESQSLQSRAIRQSLKDGSIYAERYDHVPERFTVSLNNLNEQRIVPSCRESVAKVWSSNEEIGQMWIGKGHLSIGSCPRPESQLADKRGIRLCNFGLR